MCGLDLSMKIGRLVYNYCGYLGHVSKKVFFEDGWGKSSENNSQQETLLAKDTSKDSRTKENSWVVFKVERVFWVADRTRLGLVINNPSGSFKS